MSPSTSSTSSATGTPARGEGLRVGGELQQRLDLDRPRQLGVAQPVALAVEDQEVGEADEPAVEHRRLVDHRRASFDRPQRGVGGRGQARDGVVGPADDGDGVRRQRPQLVEVALLVLAAEFGGAGEQFVLAATGGPQPSRASNERSSAYSQRAAAARSEAL